jgi:hypothetical protein
MSRPRSPRRTCGKLPAPHLTSDFSGVIGRCGSEIARIRKWRLASTRKPSESAPSQLLPRPLAGGIVLPQGDDPTRVVPHRQRVAAPSIRRSCSGPAPVMAEPSTRSSCS